MNITSWKRFTAGLLAVLMLLTLLPSAAWAADTVDSGRCGDDLTWLLDEAGKLTISGTGDMYDWDTSSFHSTPWASYRGQIYEIVIGPEVSGIGDYAFAYCTELGSITIPEGVTAIGERAFRDCTSLTAVELPDSLSTLGNFAFYRCTDLSSIRLGSGLSELGDYVFRETAYYDDADNWTDGLLYIGAYLLKAQQDITAASIRPGTRVIGNGAFDYCTALGSVTVPEGIAVISAGAFDHCSSLSEITLPDSLTRLEDNAFSFCSSLRSLTLPDGITHIGDYAFSSCTSLSEIALPDRLTHIGSHAFDGCSQLQQLELPAGVTAIGERAFCDCRSLTELRLPDSVTELGDYALVACEGLSSVHIPARLTALPTGLLSGCSSLTDVTIPESVTSIGDSAFYGCTALTGLTVPEGVTRIGSSAFRDCTALSRLTLPDGLTGVGAAILLNSAYEQEEDHWQGGLLYLDAYLLDARADITCATVRGGTRLLADSAFDSCRSLTEAIIPDSVSHIGRCAFYFCTALSDIGIGSGVSSIDWGAFLFCESLSDVYYAGTEAQWSSIAVAESNEPLQNAAIHYGWVGCIDSGTCGDALNWMLDGDGVLTISGSGQMYGYDEDGAPWAAYRQEIRQLVVLDGATYIGECAFFGCENLRSVELPDSVRGIDNRAFSGCTALEELQLPSRLTLLGYSAFAQCSSLTELCLPAGLLQISSNTFSGCTALRQVQLPAGLLAVGYHAFDGCTALTELTLPDSVTGLGDGAFQNCTALAEVHWPEGLTSIGSGVMSGTAYGNDPANWEDDILYAGPYLLEARGRDSRSSYTVRPGTRLISGGSFRDCTAAEQIILPEGVTDIGLHAFVNATALRAIVLPATLSTVSYLAFSGCTALTDVYYIGTQEQWTALNIPRTGNEPLLDAAVHYQYIRTPAAPVVSISTVTSTGRIKLTWNAVDGAEKYYIYRSTDGGKTYKYYDSTTKTSYTNTSVTPGTKYYYKLKAVSVVGEKSDYSNAVYRTADCAKPSLSSSIVSSSGAIKLSWSKVTGATKYYIYRSTDGGKTYSYYTSTTSTSWTNKNVTPGKTYYYKIKAICSNTEGNSAYSNVVSRTADCARPSVTIQLNGGKPQLKWSAIDGAKEYVIYRATSKSGTYTKMYTTTKLSYTNTGAKSGTTYYYKVMAICAKSSYGNSAYSSVVSIKSK